jgi:hypothetical protein
MVTTSCRLLSPARLADVLTVESAVTRFALHRPPPSCQVTFFEVAGDDSLHVNVTHRYETAGAKGWAGPAEMPQGYVHNRRFADMPPARVIRHIRDIVFAGRI